MVALSGTPESRLLSVAGSEDYMYSLGLTSLRRHAREAGGPRGESYRRCLCYKDGCCSYIGQEPAVLSACVGDNPTIGPLNLNTFSFLGTEFSLHDLKMILFWSHLI